MIILGIDPGLSGGFACVNGEGILVTWIMPKNEKVLYLPGIRHILTSVKPDHTYLEQVHAMHKCSAGATFKFGRVFGVLEGMLAALEMPYTLIQPKKWQKPIHEGCEADTAKGRSLNAAARMFPMHDFLPTARCYKPHDGMIDAALIAEYGRRCLNGV